MVSYFQGSPRDKSELLWLVPGVRVRITLCCLWIGSWFRNSLDLAKCISTFSDFIFFTAYHRKLKLQQFPGSDGERSPGWNLDRTTHFPSPNPPRCGPLEKGFHKEDLSVKRLLCGQIWLQLSLKVYKESGSFYKNCPKLCFNFHTRIWNLRLFLVFAITVQTKQQVKTFFSQIIWKPHITKVQCYFQPSKYRQVDLRPLVFWLCFGLN